MADAASSEAQKPRPPRADARRNRERVLVAAREAFATEGPLVSLDGIARRAGVGAGTVHRHFPTKDELLEAVIAERLHDLAGAAQKLAGAADPGEAFFAFFYRLADDARQNLALFAAFAAPNDARESMLEAGESLSAALAVLLARAQESGAVRSDIDVADLHAIMAGALVMEQRLSSPDSRGRGLAVVADGLRRP
jgi:AcrR family transcriptional regulator